MFENKDSSPFGSFVTDIFNRRQDAKREGNEAMSYIYKILMNSLYGRFGISPLFSITEICDLERYNFLVNKAGFMRGDKINESKYMVTYWSDETEDPTGWSPPRISAVQLSAAITACARIYMYPYISRDDCYYTDTDSVVLGNPLPEEMISSTELGKFKLETMVSKGIFLAPKSYKLETPDGNITKQKGATKDSVTPEWFDSQFADPSRKILTPVESNFRINRENLLRALK